MPEGAGQVGTGVEIEEINRIKDQFVEGQIWEKKQSQNYWQRRYDGIHRVENIFNEPTDDNLSAAFDNFWQSLQDLSNNPEDTAVRATVKERANTLVDAFHSIEEQLTDYKRSLNGDVKTTVDEINSLGTRISDLNEQIAHIKGTGKNPNDLMDSRDKLIEDLNKKVNVRTRQDDRGYINISIGGMSFVSGDNVNKLKTEKVSDAPNEDIIKFAELDRKADIKNGELAGLLDLRGVYNSSTGQSEGIIPDYKNKLDDMANTFANKFNDVHQNGFDFNGDSGVEFFLSDTDTNGDGTLDGSDITADSLIVNDTIKNNVKKIAAGSEANVGNGENAVQLADVIKKEQLNFDDGQANLMDKYESVISSLGVKGQRANQMVSNQDTLVEQLENKRQSISGVSLDEEMANMIKYQQAYSASAKLISNANRMLDSLMSILR